MPELDKVNFKEAKTSTKLWHGEVARPDGVTFHSGWGRCDVPPPTFELKGQPKLAVIHTRTVSVR